MGIHRLIRDSFSKAKVSQFSALVLIQEYIGWLQVPVQNELVVLAFVAFKERQDDLGEDLPNELLRNVHVAILALLYQLAQVAARTVLHDNVNGQVFTVYDLVMVTHYVLMLQLSQDVHLVYQLKLFFLFHLSIVYLLPDHLLARLFVFDKTDFTKAA